MRPESSCKKPEDGSVQVDSVYFPQHEVVGDIGNGIWQLKERLKDNPLPDWDLRCACLCPLLFLHRSQELRLCTKTAAQASHWPCIGIYEESLFCVGSPAMFRKYLCIRLRAPGTAEMFLQIKVNTFKLVTDMNIMQMGP